MAIHHKDRLSDLLDEDVPCIRTESFVWVVATQFDNSLKEANPNRPTHRDSIFAALETNKHLIDRVRHSLAKRVIPEQNFHWLDHSIRQSNWIHRNIKDCFVRSSANTIQGERPTDYLQAILVPAHLLGKDRSIALIDCYSHLASVSLNDATTSLKKLNLRWNDHLKEDVYLEWINADSTGECVAYFWKWISEKRPHQVYGRQPPNSYEQLLCILDEFDLIIQDKELYGSKARRAWTQLESRKKSKDKKQCNFLLSINSIEKLKKLSEAHKLSRTELIEFLIESESQNSFHINVREQRRKNLIGLSK